MRFIVSGVEHETEEMDTFKLGPGGSTIFIDRDCRVFVMVSRDADEPEIHQAETPEIIYLAEQSGIQDLWRAIRCPEPFN